MSRIGKAPITIPANVEVKVSGKNITVKGPKGELKLALRSEVSVNVENNTITVDVNDKENVKVRAFWGLFRNLINNMVIGVSTGFFKKMEIKGVGYRAQVNGQKLLLNLGFSHQVDFPLPEGITALVEGNFLTISGFDKQVVGEVSAQIRRLRKPEPYKGKGIRYIDEVIRRKAGKTAASK
ncbi:MAG: 50S ribosomal protein L6 [Candidatus Falkowbacteria bacterium]